MRMMMDFENGVENMNVVSVDSEKGSTSIIGKDIIEFYDIHWLFLKNVFTNIWNDTLHYECLQEIIIFIHPYSLILGNQVIGRRSTFQSHLRQRHSKWIVSFAPFGCSQ